MLATSCYERGFAIDPGKRIATDAVPRRIMQAYYAATVLFLLLDYVGGLNVRVAFLADAPGLRAAYYGFCVVCLGLMTWRPAWTAIVTAFESLVTLASLIIATGTRAILVTDAMLEGTESFISMAEIVNFLLSGSVAWLAWTRGLARFHDGLR